MSDLEMKTVHGNNYKLDLSGPVFWICVTIMVVMCSGKPDIIDGIVHFLMNRGK